MHRSRTTFIFLLYRFSRENICSVFISSLFICSVDYHPNIMKLSNPEPYLSYQNYCEIFTRDQIIWFFYYTNDNERFPYSTPELVNSFSTKSGCSGSVIACRAIAKPNHDATQWIVVSLTRFF